ncbi:class I adenylate-forming enzyme family protein [Ruminococcus flavefaciens]|uniref:Acyl-CoA synthetase (AMP-forming)/AMP-acid ligase II n=1 Tax=Ruminococcus flavefaciens TaxID=1265 RepID=A0A1K1NJL4_RUMFL|nr:class I adenylate-forming enzyme family protein [Ruminococcus flavefaciens]SFW35495.1 Acyl-CoA synthetase (AMP-forming)/AMP-acid ligase II [Ruminococcus flavefaciens]
MKTLTQVNTSTIVRKFPEWARVDRVINGVEIYNMNIFDNIMTFNQDNLDGDAIDYFGTKITYGELPALREAYAKGLKLAGVKEGDVVTLCLPVSIENLMLLFACNLIKAISNNVNFLFLKDDFPLYTKDKGSEIIITLDAFLPYFTEHLSNSSIKKVILMSLDDFLPQEKKGMFLDTSEMPEKMQEVFDIEQITECLMNLDKIKGVEFIRLEDLRHAGEHSDIELDLGPTDLDRDISYFYTSGTTSKPKCVVYKEYSLNAYVEMHAGLDTQNYVGERNFQCIPLTHMTGERVCAIMPLARGGTLVPRPIYNKYTFARDLSETNCNCVMATASFYLTSVRQGVLSPTALEMLRRPASGGEAVNVNSVRKIDKWLRDNGCNVRFSLGGGASEEGGATLVTYFMDEESKTNETGKPLEPYVYVKLVDDDGNIVDEDEVLANLHASSPASADRYLNNPEATAERWYYDENGMKWGVTGDIAVRHADGSYTIMGRASDSYIDKHGKRVYLFMIESTLDENDPINEWEISAFKNERGGYDVVGQIILDPDEAEPSAELVEYICNKYHLDAVKFYKEFEIGEITAKRDYILLAHDYRGYVAPCGNGRLLLIDYSENGSTVIIRTGKNFVIPITESYGEEE